MSNAKIICPFCGHILNLDASGRASCEKCSEEFDVGDWSSAPEAYTWHGDIGCDGCVEMPPVTSSPHVPELKCALPYDLCNKGTRVCVGSSGRNKYKTIVASKIDSLHAIFFRRRLHERESWWICDNNSKGGLFVNGERIRCKKLAVGDEIRFGSKFELEVYDGWKLGSPRKVTGLNVLVDDVTAEVYGNKQAGRLSILNDVSFQVMPGEFVGLLGPTGCGKSSLLQRIAGLADVNKGRILFNGHDRSEPGIKEALSRTMVYLPQNVDETLHNDLTVAEELDTYRRLFLAKDTDGKVRTKMRLKQLGFFIDGDDSILKKRIGDLSGGQKRRIAIARALETEPQLLLFDEPTAGLDPVAETDVMENLKRLSEQGRTVICATHILQNADKFDKILCLSGGRNSGRLAFFGSFEALLKCFDVQGISQVYPLLSAFKSASISKMKFDETPTDIPEGLPGSGFKRQLGGWLKRAWLQFSSGCSEWHVSGLSITFPSWIWHVFGLPIAFATALRIALPSYFNLGDFCSAKDTFSNPLFVVPFCSCLAVFWIGLSGAVRELVNERVPGRCLESLQGSSTGRYLLAKGVWVFAVCAVQVLVFTAAMMILWHDRFDGIYTGDKPFPFMYFPLFVSAYAGGMIGLAISSFSSTETFAVKLFPFVAFLQLLFSKVVLTDNEGAGVPYSIMKITPCHNSILWMSKQFFGDGFCKHVNVQQPVLLTFISLCFYLVLCGAICLMAQKWREKQYEGR